MYTLLNLPFPNLYFSYDVIKSTLFYSHISVKTKKTIIIHRTRDCYVVRKEFANEHY